MFKRRCPHCDKKIEKKFDFCPYCSSALRDPKDYGILGKSDEDEFDKIFQEQQRNLGMPNLGGIFGSNFFNKALTNAIGMIEKEMRNVSEQERQLERNEKQNKGPNANFQLFINGKKVNIPGNIGLPMAAPQKDNTNNEKIIQKKDVPEISEETLKKSLKLPRKEAKSKLTRLKNKVVYELDTPGIDSISNVIVNKLENSIEIKAFTDKTVFYKNLAVKLPLVQYSIKPTEGKLILEFKA